jgi:hypothetical protein
VVKEPKENIDASWNHKGNKFSVAANSGNVFIGYLNIAQNFWQGLPISKHLLIVNQITASSKPRHKSSVINVKFDQLSLRVVTSASANGTCYFTSSYIKESDEQNTAGPFRGVTSNEETPLKIYTKKSCEGREYEYHGD